MRLSMIFVLQITELISAWDRLANDILEKLKYVWEIDENAAVQHSTVGKRFDSFLC